MPENLQRLEIQNFKGLSTRNHASRIPLENTPSITGMFVTPKNALTPIDNITSETTGLSFTKITSLIPYVKSTGAKALILSDAVNLAQTSGDGTYAYIGYTTGTCTRSGTALTGVGTAWASNITTADKFKYDADSTWLDIAAVGSDTSITLGSDAGAASGAYTIRKVCGGAHRVKGVVQNDVLLLCDGSRLTDQWNGTSLTDVSGMPVMRGLELHKRHVFGYDGDTIYWADINAPTTWTATNKEVVSTKDGGDIIAIKSYANSLCIFKSHGKIFQLVGEAPFDATASTYELIEADVPEAIGTIAPESITIHQNNLLFATNTGLYVFDGVSVTKISDNIDATLDGITFPNALGGTAGASITDDTAAEFDAGTHSDTDYNDTNEYLELDPDKVLDDFTDGDFTNDPTWTEVSGGFSISSNSLYDSLPLYGSSLISTPSTNAYGQWEFDITCANNGGISYIWIMASASSATADGYAVVVKWSSNQVWLARMTSGVPTIISSQASVTLNPATYYTIKVTRSAAGGFTLYVDGSSVTTCTNTTYTTSTHFMWQCFGAYGATNFNLDNIKTTALSGTFTSQVFDGGALLSSWNNITVDADLNGEAFTLKYRAEASNPPTGAWTTITSGADLGTVTNRYLQYQILPTSTNAVGVSPYINSVTVNYSVTADVATKPVAASFQDRWHLSFTKGGAANDESIILDKDNQWVGWDAEAATFAVFNDQLYIGHPSSDTVKKWYTGDTTVGTTRSWKSKIIDFDIPESEKFFDRVVIIFKHTSCTLSVDYDIDQSGTFTTENESLAKADSNDHPVRTVVINKVGNNIQLRLQVADETEDFEIHRIILYWRPLELR